MDSASRVFTDLELASSQHLYLQFRHHVGYAEMRYPLLENVNTSSSSSSDVSYNHSSELETSHGMNGDDFSSDFNLNHFLSLIKYQGFIIKKPGSQQKKDSHSPLEKQFNILPSGSINYSSAQYELFTEIPKIGYVCGYADILMYQMLEKTSRVPLLKAEMLSCGRGGMDHLQLCVNTFKGDAFPSLIEIRRAIIISLIASIETYRLIPVLLTNNYSKSILVVLQLGENGCPLMSFQPIPNLIDFFHDGINLCELNPSWFREFLTQRGFQKPLRFESSLIQSNIDLSMWTNGQEVSIRDVFGLRQTTLDKMKNVTEKHKKKKDLDEGKRKLKRDTRLKSKMNRLYLGELNSTRQALSIHKNRKKKKKAYSLSTSQIPPSNFTSESISSKDSLGSSSSSGTKLHDGGRRTSAHLCFSPDINHSHTRYENYYGDQRSQDNIRGTRESILMDSFRSPHEKIYDIPPATRSFMDCHTSCKKALHPQSTNDEALEHPVDDGHHKAVRRSSRPYVVITTTAAESASRLEKLKRPQRSMTRDYSSSYLGESNHPTDEIFPPRKRRGRPRKLHAPSHPAQPTQSSDDLRQTVSLKTSKDTNSVPKAPSPSALNPKQEPYLIPSTTSTNLLTSDLTVA